MPTLRGTVVPVIAEYTQVVEIHWRLADGAVFVEQRRVPPQPTTAARKGSSDE